jgi:hypothetical protein
MAGFIGHVDCDEPLFFSAISLSRASFHCILIALAKGKPFERTGRKATDLPECVSNDSGVAE